MNLNLNDPDSIVAWWQVLPERHSAFLDYKLRASPEFAPAIREAQRRIASDYVLGALVSASVPRRDQGGSAHDGLAANVTTEVSRRRELEAA